MCLCVCVCMCNYVKSMRQQHCFKYEMRIRHAGGEGDGDAGRDECRLLAQPHIECYSCVFCWLLATRRYVCVAIGCEMRYRRILTCKFSHVQRGVCKRVDVVLYVYFK